jgi:hypothetical protein
VLRSRQIEDGSRASDQLLRWAIQSARHVFILAPDREEMCVEIERICEEFHRLNSRAELRAIYLSARAISRRQREALLARPIVGISTVAHINVDERALNRSYGERTPLAISAPSSAIRQEIAALVTPVSKGRRGKKH